MTALKIEDSRTLVVGGAGFVGSNLVLALLEQGARQVIVVDNLLSSEASNIPLDPRVVFIHGSIADQRILNKLPDEIDFIWHLACYHGNQSSIADPIADHDNNTLTSLMLFEHLSQTIRTKKVVYAAAGCAVAEKTAHEPVATREDAPISLFHDSPYSISKIIGEMYGNYYYKKSGLPFVRARFQNVYGPGEILGAGQWRGTPATVWRNVVPTFIWKAINNQPLVLENGGQGSRDFIFVRDLVEGLLACALLGSPGQAYNLASGIETTILDLSQKIVEITKSTSAIEFGKSRGWDNSIRRFGSTEKSRLELDFSARTTLTNGLGITVDWFFKNRLHIDQVMSRHGRHFMGQEIE